MSIVAICILCASHFGSTTYGERSAVLLRTGQARFLASGSSIGQRTFSKHAVAPIGLGVHLDVTPTVPAAEVLSVAEAAPAWVIATPPTYLPCFLRRLAVLSRPPTPEGSLHPFGQGDVATPIRPITGRRSLPPSSFTPSPISCLAASFPLREDLRLTTFR